VPLHLTKTKLSEGGAASWNFQMITRLKPSITPAQAVTDAERVAHEIMRNYPAFMASLQITAVVRPLAGGHRSSGSPKKGLSAGIRAIRRDSVRWRAAGTLTRIWLHSGR
jgi:hypothetical protein